MKRSPWSPRSTAVPPDRDLAPYWESLAEAERADSFDEVAPWLRRAEHAPRGRTASSWRRPVQAPPLRLALAALIVMFTGVACAIPVAHDAPFGTLVTGTLPMANPSAHTQLAALPSVDVRLLTTTGVFDPWQVEASTAFALVLDDNEAIDLNALHRDLRALGGTGITTETLTEPRTAPVYQLVLRALPRLGDERLTEAERHARREQLEDALATHRAALEAEHVAPTFVVGSDGATDLTWADTPTPATFGEALDALGAVQPFLVDALGNEALLAMAAAALPDASPETLRPLAELVERLQRTQDADGQARLLERLRAELDADGTLTQADLEQIVGSFD
ncbi:MAG: hypothetical protein AAF730_01910 [Bacteroidota bacterium]